MTFVQGARKIVLTVEVGGHSIYKWTLVSQLTGNVFLSKARLARSKHSIQFNNHDNCLQSGSSCRSSLLCIGSNCGVHFVQRSTTRLSSTVRSAAKRKRGHSSVANKAGNATNTLNGVDEGSWWVGRCKLCSVATGNNLGCYDRRLTSLLEQRNHGGETLTILILK